MAQCIVRTEPSAANTPATKAAHQAVHLRSFKIPTPKASIAPKVAQALAELGIQHTRLVMPTRENLLHLEALLDATYSLIEVKKVMDKVYHEIRTYKMRLSMRNSDGRETHETDRAGVDGVAEEDSLMDIDAEGVPDIDAEGIVDKDAEGIPDKDAEDSADRDAEGDEEETALSIVSTRSGRSRKPVGALFLHYFLYADEVLDAKIDVHIVCGYVCDYFDASRSEETEKKLKFSPRAERLCGRGRFWIRSGNAGILSWHVVISLAYR